MASRHCLLRMARTAALPHLHPCLPLPTETTPQRVHPHRREWASCTCRQARHHLHARRPCPLLLLLGWRRQQRRRLRHGVVLALYLALLRRNSSSSSSSSSKHLPRRLCCCIPLRNTGHLRAWATMAVGRLQQLGVVSVAALTEAMGEKACALRFKRRESVLAATLAVSRMIPIVAAVAVLVLPTAKGCATPFKTPARVLAGPLASTSTTSLARHREPPRVELVVVANSNAATV